MLNKKTMAAASGSAVTTDPNFEYVTMLLHGDGTNGAQNNTFTDGSTNNFTITRNGNTTQGSLNPFGDRWSNYFDGNADFLQTPTNTALAFNSTDYTAEAWVYADMGTYSSFDSGGRGITSDYLTTNSGRWLVAINSSQKLEFIEQNALGASSVTVTDTVNFPLGTWVHVAAVKSGTTMYLFKNGVSVGTATSATRTGFPGRINIGQFTVDSGFRGYWLGYISNVRLLKGTALYTSNFTPPSAPLTSITNTSLLTCQSNRFVDNSSNNFTITRNGDVAVRPFSPFSPSAAYSTSTNGGSGYFDGTGDWLTIPDNAALNVGSGDFTIEMWIFRTKVASGTNTDVILSKGNSNIGIGILTTGLLIVVNYNGPTLLTSTSAIALGVWYHVATTRSGTTMRLFINGVQEASTTSSTNFTSTSNLGIGVDVAFNTQRFGGYLSSLRLVKGTAVYTAAFTPPTSPPTAITNTSLLLNFINGGIIDNAADNVLETVGNAQISTSVKKFGTGSLAFDGSGDRLVAPDNVEFAFGTGDFTIEAWVWLDSTVNPIRPDNLKTVTIFSTGSASANDCSFAIYGSTSVAGVGLELYQASPSIALSVAATVTTNTWVHIAYVRSGTTIYGFVNGTRYTIGTTSAAIASSVSPKIGAANSSSYTNQFKGYIDDLRVTKGVARYTANFTPPTAPFPDT